MFFVHYTIYRVTAMKKPSFFAGKGKWEIRAFAKKHIISFCIIQNKQKACYPIYLNFLGSRLLRSFLSFHFAQKESSDCAVSHYYFLLELLHCIYVIKIYYLWRCNT